jgi:hypothetical protein
VAIEWQYKEKGMIYDFRNSFDRAISWLPPAHVKVGAFSLNIGPELCNYSMTNFKLQSG